LEYVKNNRGQNRLPDQPVIFIFTTFENNYHLAIQEKNPKNQNKDTMEFRKRFDGFKRDFHRNNVNLGDEVKCYWIPENFENRMENVKKLLSENASSNKLKP
jgi:hypothetical protein